LNSSSLKRTPLYEAIKALGARFVDFGGWEMPVYYSGIIEEHHAVRNAVGIFDVSHMGQITISGPDGLAFLQHLTTNEVSHLEEGQAKYSILCNEAGDIIDDIIFYRLGPSEFLICVNATNADKDFEWIKSQQKGFNVTVANKSPEYAQIALQGPMAEKTIKPLLDIDPATIKNFRAAEVKIQGSSALLTRTGYTGEDGFEIYFSPTEATKIWNALLESGKQFGIKPIGLGARDTLRTEMKYALYGNDISEDTSPLEANLSWVVKFDKDFIGKPALLEQKERGVKRKLVGFELVGRGIARPGYSIFDKDEKEVGKVTSGCMSPTLGKAIGIGYVPTELASVGSKLLIQIRNKFVEANVVKTPFYKPH
jgi:aminomethyltransferase